MIQRAYWNRVHVRSFHDSTVLDSSYLIDSIAEAAGDSMHTRSSSSNRCFAMCMSIQPLRPRVADGQFLSIDEWSNFGQFNIARIGHDSPPVRICRALITANIARDSGHGFEENRDGLAGVVDVVNDRMVNEVQRDNVSV